MNIIQYLDQLSQMHSHLTVENFGFTAEGRPMKGVKISTDSTKPIIWIDAGIHAREWIAPATALSIINKLMRPSGQALLKHFQFFIVPVVNPDGYEYTRSKEHYDIWMLPRHQNTSMYISVSPAGFQNLTNYLKSLNISFEITINNLQNLKVVTDKSGNFHFMKNIIQYLDQLSQMHSHLTVENFGFTAEGRPMKGVKISTDSTKPIIWIDAGIHAREWIAPATALSIINKLMRPSGQALLKHFQFFIVPVVNPDGYEYTRSKYRLWRKNRAQTEVGNGASPHSCSETYRGSVAASELETQSIIKKLNILQKQIILYLSLHSFGQYILTPFGFSRYNYPPYYQKLVSATDDYVTGELKIPYAYTIELCDEGRYRFLLPPSYIGQVGRQLWTALTVLANDILPT
ncbi:Carboxypeptidase A2 [Schistosoma japonicum]|nr:Carboxypeptidase A2 [Schistosoma japonicum]